ncbi:alpha/beta fold hydrolase [Microbacterium immunditiarum]|uniref:Pimeloyl-ACP methyl ester carboxylesterase n=1 Tax=Microbacterium immunditiarum TaxID=337480 RepID=A0A7Y9GM40_9MICO|nr:alpha/beta hydrolase [Microbacterium immunditiarum]NYE18957.1 pimeloyl-ACP methyl ester carboxylesterase [Microbacterium immunditiarum]
MTDTVFLPGLTQDEHAFDLVGLPGRTAVYPGHGERPPEPITMAQIADEIAVTLTEPVDIVGVALGGIVGQYLLIRHPDLVRSAVLANTPSGFSDPATVVARADDVLRTGVLPGSDELVGRWFRPETIAADGPGVRYIRERIATITPEGFAFMQRAMAGTDTGDQLPEVVVPVTLVQATDDVVGPGSVARIGRLLRNSRMVETPGSHMVHLDNPDGFRDVIVGHRRWVEGGEG